LIEKAGFRPFCFYGPIDFLPVLFPNWDNQIFQTMPKIPKWPKGLRRRLAKAKRKKEQAARAAARRKEIADARKELARLTR
jgi:hypothetical protein